jgi:uncharacterized protein (DUF433 family)
MSAYKTERELKMHAAKTISYIAVDDKGTPWVAGTSFKVKDIVEDKKANGWTPEEIQHQHPGQLTLAQIHAALAFYYDNMEEIDKAIEAELQYVENLRLAQTNSAINQKLKSIAAAQ